MNDEPMMIDETEDFAEPRRGARRSWKKFQLVVTGLVAVFVAWVAVASPASNNWNKTFGGITEAHIAKFEQAMDEYFDEVERRNLTRVTMARYDSLQPDEYSEAEEVEKGTYDARERLRKLVDGMNYSNRQKARARFALWAHSHNGDEIPSEVILEGADGSGRAWVMRNIPAGVWTAIKAAVIAFVATWLFLKLCELIWWFFIDRVRDVADAVRKS
jgi:hypothetical protein